MFTNPADYVYFVLMGVWVVGDVLLFMRYWQYKRSYLRYFSPVKRVPFDTYLWAMWERQAIPELERMRRKVWWRSAHVHLWILGFPMLAFGVTLLLIPVFPH